MGLLDYVAENNNYVFSSKLRKTLINIELLSLDVRINISQKIGREPQYLTPRIIVPVFIIIGHSGCYRYVAKEII